MTTVPEGGPGAGFDAGYLTLAESWTGESEIKRSRFLTFLRPVTSEHQAREEITEVRDLHPAARHHCTAFVLGARGPKHPAVQRSNDDGEPSGTAGAPMLEALVAFGVADVLAVVVRYFGGVLLGAGGLTRAYRAAVADTLATAPVVRRVERSVLAVTLDYAQAHVLATEAAAAGWACEQIFGAEVETVLGVPGDQVAAAQSRIAALCAGLVQVVARGTEWVDVPL